MDIVSLVLILLATLINFVDGIASLVGAFTESYLPDFVGISFASVQVFLLFLATVFSLINCFSSKVASRLQKYLLLAVSSALFFANLNWLIAYFANKVIH